MGLSPRTRGNPFHCLTRFPGTGSIPAYTGEPRDHQVAGDHDGVYPRVHGGTQGEDATGYVDHGLSPRTRGNPLFATPYQSFMRSIPAYTGEPTPPALNRKPHPVYPRVHGGTTVPVSSTHQTTGLSPRTRGNPCKWHWPLSVTGSIPAYTGEPAVLCQSVGRSRVYPRVHGGTKILWIRFTSPQGLSPRTRGNPLLSSPCLF